MDSVHTVWLGKMKCQPKNVPYDCCFVSFLVNRSKILSLAVKNIQVNLIFLARLFVSLHFIVCTYCVWNEKY